MAQSWHDLLFAHWPIPLEAMRPLVPAQLPLDTFDGTCWIGIVPFHMSGVRSRGLPAFPRVSHFAELNVRTYVTLNGKPGVYFFSLDAASSAAVWAARRFYHLPYFQAEMQAEVSRHVMSYQSSRFEGKARFVARYGPVQPVRLREPGTLEHWLTERYCLYAVHENKVWRGDVHHAPWPLQDADAEISENTMAAAAGITLPPTAPLLHFASRLDVLIWPLQRLAN